MAKEPPNLPSVGDAVKLRGHSSRGILQRLDEDRKWAWVSWDNGLAKGPRICHLYELEKVRGSQNG